MWKILRAIYRWVNMGEESEIKNRRTIEKLKKQPSQKSNELDD